MKVNTTKWRFKLSLPITIYIQITITLPARIGKLNNLHNLTILVCKVKQQLFLLVFLFLGLASIQSAKILQLMNKKIYYL